MFIGISGARSLTEDQVKQLKDYLAKMPQSSTDIWHIGDAKGVDQIARLWATENNITIEIYNAISREPWALQQRSKRLVDAIGAMGGELWAFPVKECPIGLTPQHCKSWKGAGTWGTVAYAMSRSVRVHVVPLGSIGVPAWCQQHQPNLF
jgi:hypothetical protein